MQADGDAVQHAVGGEAGPGCPDDGPGVSPEHDDGARNYAFTCWEPFPTLDLLDEAFEEVKTSYIIMGSEVCPSTGRKHLQCFVSFDNRIKWESALQIYPWACRLRAAFKPALANYRYCTKDGNIYFEKGGRPKGMGKRSDLDDARQLILDGKTDREYAMSVTSWAAINSYKRLKLALLPAPPKRRSDKEFIYIWGPPGTGKSYHADDIAPDAYEKGADKWFCDYAGQDTIIIDECRPDNTDFVMLLKITDQRHSRQEVKGGSVMINARRIIVTSPFSPDNLYAGCLHENMLQLARRITQTIHLAVPYKQ